MKQDSGRYSLTRSLLLLGSVLLVEGGFAVGVMLLDRRNRGLPDNVLYVVVVEASIAALVLCLYAVRVIRERRGLEKAMAAPLDSYLPEAPGYEASLWKDLLLEARRHAREEAAGRERKAREDLEAFLSTVHALKTPATALSLMAERAERDGTPLDVAGLRLEVDELDRILDRAIGRLRLADFEQGSRMARIQAGEAVRASVRKHRRIFIARNVSAEIEGSFVAESDLYWLSFILDQLVSNAAKYASSRILIRLSTEGRHGNIAICDDGPGFSEEDSLRAFGRSASGSAGLSADRGPASSGYGLHLARQAAARLGASLRFEPGKGTIAVLELPLALDPLSDITKM
jgi:signal transduction histidine kinase